MRLRNAFLLVFLLIVVIALMMSSTLSGFRDEFGGSDFALVAKWKFGARGEDDIEGEFYNKGFTFNLFDESVQPMDYGSKSFTFTGGGSDVAIEYDVEMSLKDLYFDEYDGYPMYPLPPFIFRIQVEIEGVGDDESPNTFTPFPGQTDDYDSGWFRPQDIYDEEFISFDEDGFFSIFRFPGYFSIHSEDKVTVTVSWQWNTSFFADGIIPTTEIGDETLLYHEMAAEEYNLLEQDYYAASNSVDDYLDDHGGGPADGIWEHYIPCTLDDQGHQDAYDFLTDDGDKAQYLLDHHGVADEDTGEITWSGIYHEVLCPADHFSDYNALVASLNQRIAALENSLYMLYSDYDSRAIDALTARDSVRVLFRIRGDQITLGI